MLGVAGAGMLAHALYSSAGVGKPDLSGFFDDWVYNGVYMAAARGLPAARDSTDRRSGPPGLVAGGLVPLGRSATSTGP